MDGDGGTTTGPPIPSAVTTGGTVGDTGERRRARRIVAGGAACLLLVVAVPRLTDPGTGTPVPASGASAGSVQVPAYPTDDAPPDGDGGGGGEDTVFGGPTRGSLAGDRAFVEGVRALPWTPDPPPPSERQARSLLPDPPLETRSVVFAGEVSDGRWALVVGWAPSPPLDPAEAPDRDLPDQFVAAWFAGPPGAGPERMTLRGGPSGIAPYVPLAATDPRTGDVVVVAAPGDAVDVSRKPVVDADGSTSREWRGVDTVDGIAVTRVSPFARVYDASTSYRVHRHGRTVARDAPWSFLAEPPDPALPIAYPRGRPTGLGERAATGAAEHLLAELGLSPAEVEITAQWVGGLPDGSATQVAVVTVTLPTGAIAIEGQALLPEGTDGATTGAFCGQAILPAGPPAERRVEALTCESFDPATGVPRGGTLVVVAPPQVGLVRTYDGDRTFLGEHAATDGVVVVPLAPGTDTVEAVTTGGVTLGRVELIGQTADFGD